MYKKYCYHNHCIDITITILDISMVIILGISMIIILDISMIIILDISMIIMIMIIITATSSTFCCNSLSLSANSLRA